MIGDEGRVYVYNRNRILYYVTLFLAFFGAVKIQPWLATQVITLVPYVWLHQILPWVIAYLAAIYILPAIGFTVIKSVLGE